MSATTPLLLHFFLPAPLHIQLTKMSLGRISQTDVCRCPSLSNERTSAHSQCTQSPLICLNPVIDSYQAPRCCCSASSLTAASAKLYATSPAAAELLSPTFFQTYTSQLPPRRLPRIVALAQSDCRCFFFSFTDPRYHLIKQDVKISPVKASPIRDTILLICSFLTTGTTEISCQKICSPKASSRNRSSPY